MSESRPISTLVVDNSPVLLRIVANILEEAGCRVTTARNGLEALEALTEELPDIIYTDLIMPRIDGAKLTRILRSTPAYRDIFLVILSAIALEDGTNVLELGADVCIAKGPAATLRKHILDSLRLFRQGKSGSTSIAGMQGLYPREVTSELLLITRHDQIIFDHMTEGMIEMDGFSRIVRVNRTACALFGRKEPQLLSMDFTTLLGEDDARTYDRWLERLLPHQDDPLVFGYEDPLRVGDRMLTCTLIPVHEENQLSILGILEDVTERRLADEQRRILEQEMERMRKLDAMANMASGIAHDFNNLLTIINGNVEMALLQNRDEQLSVLLRETQKALRLTTNLIRRFSTFSDNYLPSKARIRIDRFLRDLLAGELEATSISFSIDTEPEAECVEFDPDLMLQVFQNIIRNSSEAMQGQGEIRVRIAMVAPEQEKDAADGLVEIRMIDTGPGMDSHTLEKAFDPYFSTKQKGTQKGMGLGLTIAHAIVQKHGGTMRLESEPGRGCTAIVRLPAQPTPARPTRDELFFRVLALVRDSGAEEECRQSFARFNCQLTVLQDKGLAVEQFTRSWQEGDPYDLVLLDLQAGGRDVGEAMAALNPKTVLVGLREAGGGDAQIEDSGVFATVLERPVKAGLVEQLFNICIKRFTC